MKDREFLMWLHDRLEHVHSENPLIDYMHKLRAIIEVCDPEQDSRPRDMEVLYTLRDLN